jgi:hypothetical protein
VTLNDVNFNGNIADLIGGVNCIINVKWYYLFVTLTTYSVLIQQIEVSICSYHIWC